jgi:glycine betaine/proline transport system permease protein
MSLKAEEQTMAEAAQAGIVASIDVALRPSTYGELPLEDWVEWFVKDWLVPNFRPTFRAAQWPVDQVLQGLEAFLQGMPFILMVIIIGLFALRLTSKGITIFTIFSLLLLEILGLWPETMTTLAMTLTAVFFCTLLGIPLGIAAAASDRFDSLLRPILDIMQTIPPFVYLVPIVMLFGIGVVPGVIATIIFALPPIIRLTNLGIRQVRSEVVEAGYAFGATSREVLFDIQIPMALRTIMAGLNQTLMLALSMAVIAALIGAGGLGLTVYTGLGRLDVGRAFLGGLGIVLLAIILDRITQGLATQGAAYKPGWTFKGVAARLQRFGGAPRQVAKPAE